MKQVQVHYILSLIFYLFLQIVNTIERYMIKKILEVFKYYYVFFMIS